MYILLKQYRSINILCMEVYIKFYKTLNIYLLDFLFNNRIINFYIQSIQVHICVTTLRLKGLRFLANDHMYVYVSSRFSRILHLMEPSLYIYTDALHLFYQENELKPIFTICCWKSTKFPFVKLKLHNRIESPSYIVLLYFPVYLFSKKTEISIEAELSFQNIIIR